jgi:hypothetical protein
MSSWKLLGVGLLLSLPVLGQDAPGATKSVTPLLQEAALPIYPPIWRVAHFTGKTVVLVTVKGGRVVETEAKSGEQHLQEVTIRNLKTWRFADNVNTTLTVTYNYVIAGEETDGPTNPTVEILPSLDVNITARPVKPTVNHGAQGGAATESLVHESGHLLDPPKPQ